MVPFAFLLHRMLYSSITPYVHLVKTGKGWDGDDQDQEMLDFANGRHGSFGVRTPFSHHLLPPTTLYLSLHALATPLARR